MVNPWMFLWITSRRCCILPGESVSRRQKVIVIESIDVRFPNVSYLIHSGPFDTV